MYTGEALPAVGRAHVLVAHQGQRVELSLFVVRGEGPALLGRSWLARFQLDWTAPASGLGRPVPSRLENRLEDVPLSEFVPPGAPVPPSDPVPPFESGPPSRPEGEVPVAGAAALRRWCLFLASCDDDMRFWNSGDRDGATVSRACFARRVHFRHDHPTGLVCSH